MYLLSIYFENAQKNGSGKFCFTKDHGKIRKWTQLSADRSNLELLQLMALACCGTRFLSHLPHKLQQLCRNYSIHLQLEIILTPHSCDSSDRRSNSQKLLGSGIQIDNEGKIKRLIRKDCHFLPPDLSLRELAIGTGNSSYFLLAYGSDLQPHDLTDDFDFTNPFFRVTRFHSLFNKQALITDPVAFLIRLHYKGVLVSRYPAIQTMQSLKKVFKEYLDIDTGRWMDKACNFRKEWSRLYPWQKRAALPVLDAVRHMIDAFPRSGTPLNMPGLLLLDRPDLFCTEKIFPQWITLMDQLFPKMQFVLTLSEKSRLNFSHKTQRKRLFLPAPIERKKAKRPARILPGAVLLLDVDSRLPNLALMKISRYFKEQGRKVVLARKDSFIKGVEAVYASCVFFSFSSLKRIKRLQKYYGESLVLGGSGVDVFKRLPRKIEKLPADYSLYPELKDRAIGFLTRGCPFNCPFCIVPVKEGKIHQVSDLDSLLGNGRRKLILLDDNILSHPRAGDFLEEMAIRGLKVNFTQTLDICLLDREKAQLLKRIHCSNLKFTRLVYHFSLNDSRDLDRVRCKYNVLGFTSRDNVEFICMYGYNTTLAEDVERFSFLRSLPGAYVFVQEYQQIPGSPSPNLVGFFNSDADELIDKLIRIVFPQNMKSMEKYYRWLSRVYAQTFGKLHNGLVDTIFRYNSRDRKGLYISTLSLCLPQMNHYQQKRFCVPININLGWRNASPNSRAFMKQPRC